jgi:hypothetical protein
MTKSKMVRIAKAYVDYLESVKAQVEEALADAEDLPEDHAAESLAYACREGVVDFDTFKAECLSPSPYTKALGRWDTHPNSADVTVSERALVKLVAGLNG